MVTNGKRKNKIKYKKSQEKFGQGFCEDKIQGKSELS